MLAQFIGLEFSRVRIHRVERRELQRHVDYGARRFRHSRRRMRIRDRIESLITNVGDDVDRYRRARKLPFQCRSQPAAAFRSQGSAASVARTFRERCSLNPFSCASATCLPPSAPAFARDRNAVGPAAARLEARTFNPARFQQHRRARLNIRQHLRHGDRRQLVPRFLIRAAIFVQTRDGMRLARAGEYWFVDRRKRVCIVHWSTSKRNRQADRRSSCLCTCRRQKPAGRRSRASHHRGARRTLRCCAVRRQ